MHQPSFLAQVSNIQQKLNKGKTDMVVLLVMVGPIFLVQLFVSFSYVYFFSVFYFIIENTISKQLRGKCSVFVASQWKEKLRVN